MKISPAALTLDTLKAGQTAIIKRISDAETAAKTLRLGISAGEIITCITRIPAGPVVIRQGGIELAIGQGLCQKIEVELLS